MEYGLIFHVTPSGITFREIRADIPRYAYREYYCKNMKYRINTKYSTLPSGITAYIVPKVGIFPEAGGRGKYSLPRVQYMPIFHKEGF